MRYRVLSFLFAIFLPLASPHGRAQSPASVQRAREIYVDAQSAFQNASTDAAAAWKLGRAAFDLADLARSSEDRRKAATAGIEACRIALSLEPACAAAYYYLGLNLGQLARTKRIGALRGLGQMEHALLKAAQLDPAFDHAGPDRSLGMLYLEAPSWPASVGNRNKARAHLQAAVKLAPDYPDNRIALAEAYARWREPKNLERELAALAELLPRVQSEFPREIWTASWNDWDVRIEKLHKAGERLAIPPISSGERGASRIK